MWTNVRRPVSVAINVSIQNTSLNWKRNSLEYFIDSRYFSYSGEPIHQSGCQMGLQSVLAT